MVAQEVIAAPLDTQVHEPHETEESINKSPDVKPQPINEVTARESKPEPAQETQPEAKLTSAPAPKKKRKNLQAGVKDAIQLGIFTLVTAFVGGAMRGDWIILLVHIIKVWYPDFELSPSTAEVGEVAPEKEFWDYFENWHIVVALSVGISFLTYYGLGGYLQYAYYIKRKDEAHEWKCQPTRWLTPENERHEILMGSFNMFLGGSISGFAATWVLNGGPSTMYFSPGEHGYVYLLLPQAPSQIPQPDRLQRLRHAPGRVRPVSVRVCLPHVLVSYLLRRIRHAALLRILLRHDRPLRNHDGRRLAMATRITLP